MCVCLTTKNAHTFLPEEVGEEADEERVLVRVLEAQLLDGADDEDLEFVRDVRHEGRDLGVMRARGKGGVMGVVVGVVDIVVGWW